MKNEHINDLYYRGFEGEPEIGFLYENKIETHVFKMWIGYFDTVLANMISTETIKNEFLTAYNLHEGWYDESPWEIRNPNEVIQFFKDFNISTIDHKVNNHSSSILSSLPQLINHLVEFLEGALERHQKVFVIYD